MISLPRLYISAIKKNSGKTTISLAIARILSQKYKVLTFKKGPDYIDPMWLECASKNKCYNLDFFFLKDKIYDYFADKIVESECNFCLIEGNHGLFDDIYDDGRSSNASLAKITKSPVILILDVSEFGRTLAALVQGCINFDKDVQIAGIVLNKVQSKRQETKLAQAIKDYTNLPILGVIPNQESTILQRHLGLTSTLTIKQRCELIENIASAIKPYLNIDEIVSVANLSQNLYFNRLEKPIKKLNREITLAVAYDEAFNFYYHQNIENLCSMGVKIKKFSPLYDTDLSNADAVYIGGGFPELFLETIEKNASLRNQIWQKSQEGLPIYAECGGLMYLTKSIEYNGNIGNLCGVFDFHTKLSKRPIGHGYTILSPKNQNSFLNSNKIFAHEFHHGYFENNENLECFFNVERGYGINGTCDGAVKNNVLANFSHIFDYENDFFYNWIKSNKLDS